MNPMNNMAVFASLENCFCSSTRSPAECIPSIPLNSNPLQTQLLCNKFSLRQSAWLKPRHPKGLRTATASSASGKHTTPETTSKPPATLALEIADVFFKPTQSTHASSHLRTGTKITVVGVGNVGMAIAQTILTQELTTELALVDIQADKLRGEMLDLQHAAAFLTGTKIVADTDYAVTAGSDICVITAGARQREGESRLDLVERNFHLFKSIVPQLVKYSPDTVLLVVSNPVDILTYIAWKLSGLPSNKVMGSGTNLDSSRFRFMIADHLDVNAQDVQAYIIGEHGDSSVALWSSISVGGVPVLSFLDKQEIPYEKKHLEAIHQAVVNSAYEVIKLKGYTSWAIGYSTASLVKSVLRNQRRIHPVSVMAKDFHGIQEEVFLSLPAQLGRGGILGVASVHLTEEETHRLKMSADAIFEVQKQLDI